MTHTHDGHADVPKRYDKAFGLGIALNFGFVLVEAFYGWKVDSLALLADAGHNLSDVGGLILAWAALSATRLQPNDRHTFGWRRGSILASFINAFVLLIAMGSLGWEAFQRLQAPVPIAGVTVMLVAGIGILVNTITAWLFISGSRNDLNLRGAFLHMSADALVSVGVLLAGALYQWKGWYWIDPVISLVIAVIIVVTTWSLFRKSLHLLFDGVPDQVNLPSIRQYLLSQPGITDIHDLHVWAMSTTEVALTAHLVMASLPDSDQFLQDMAEELREHFEITHCTLQLERDLGCSSGCSGL